MAFKLGRSCFFLSCSSCRSAFCSLRVAQKMCFSFRMDLGWCTYVSSIDLEASCPPFPSIAHPPLQMLPWKVRCNFLQLWAVNYLHLVHSMSLIISYQRNLTLV